MRTKKIAVILSGCGVYDGAEIQESVLTLLAIANNGYSYSIFAPDIPQMHVINHVTGKEMEEGRSVLVEAARIARGKIQKLNEFDVNEFDALVLPGGFGAAKNLSSFAIDGSNMSVNNDLENALVKMKASGKPIGAVCISPVILSKLFGKIELTLGHDDPAIEKIKNMGSLHMNTDHGQIVIDKKNKIVTAPCYMLDAKITDIEKETSLLIKALVGLID